jgi:hypothetical protein
VTENEVARLAAAIAQANGHSRPQEYAASVVEAWKAVGHPDAPIETEEA